MLKRINFFTLSSQMDLVQCLESLFHPSDYYILPFYLQGKMIGFEGDKIIHTFNKNEHAIHSSDYFYNIKHRENLLLLGDSLGDLKMAEGAEHVECSLKIGFLNFKVCFKSLFALLFFNASIHMYSILIMSSLHM